MATHGIGNLVHGRLLTSGKGVPSATPQQAAAQIHPASAETGLQIVPHSESDFGKIKQTPAEIFSTAAPISPRSLGHAKVWGAQDRVEHALRRVELAIWEQERIEENRVTYQNGRGNDQSQVSSIYLHRLIGRLTMLGVSPVIANNIAFLFSEHNSQLGLRTLMDQSLAASGELLGVLQQLNIPWRHSEV